MIILSGMFSMESVPPGNDCHWRLRKSVELLGLTEATSNAAGVACAWITPMQIGVMRAAQAAATSKSFFPRVSLPAIPDVMMASILFLRSDPVTPEVQVRGDST